MLRIVDDEDATADRLAVQAGDRLHDPFGRHDGRELVGATALTRIPKLEQSAARYRVRWFSAAFEAA